ncbi:MAG: hypothetical protein AB1468_02270 [Candidatus Micrarchaeota archaeon]
MRVIKLEPSIKRAGVDDWFTVAVKTKRSFIKENLHKLLLILLKWEVDIMATQNVVRLAQYDGNQGLTVRQAINTANDRRITLMPNKSESEDITKGFDGRLVLTDTWKKEKEVYPAWTGTFFIHGKKDAPLPKTIEYPDPETKETWVVDTGNAAGLRNVILALNHGFKEDGTPLIKLHDDKNRIVVEITDPKEIAILENFPVKDGWYLADSAFGIPIGEKVDSSDPNARRLYRIGDEKAGLLARGYGCLVGYDDRRYVFAGVRPSFRFGVLGLESGEIVAMVKPELKQLATEVEKVLQKPAGELTQEDWAKIKQLVEATKSQ